MKLSRKIYLKSLPIGGGSPITVQTMTKVPTSDWDSLSSEVRKLFHQGADIIRVAVKFPGDVENVGRLVKAFDGPIVADIHFNHKLAIEVIKRGVAGIRLNPGNIAEESKIDEILKAVRDYNPGLVIRVGMNSGSIPDDLRDRELSEALVEGALRYISILENKGFFNIKVSLKASDVPTTIKANERFREVSDYPLHLGITATGDVLSGVVKSSIGIGYLLLKGIGDTIRVSLNADPVEEVKVGRKILSALGLGGGVDLIACPTCGRSLVDIKPIVKDLSEIIDSRPELFKGIRRIAVMGCEVNGPGEAKEADLGVACGRGWGLIFVRGKVIRRVRFDDIIRSMLEEVARLREGNYGTPGKSQTEIV